MANRNVHVAMLPALMRREGLQQSAVCVVDLLRASTTLVRAIESGATAIRLVNEPADAIRERDALGVGGAIAAGERHGVAPAGFDLGNSPGEFTPERVGGKTVVFTTTNGTKTVQAAKSAGLVIVGCLQNRRAIGARLAAFEGPAMIACSGTEGRIALEDCIAAGAILDAMLEWKPGVELSDPAKVCVWAWRGASKDAATLAKAVGESTGAANLEKLGLGADITECLRVDAAKAVPHWNGEAITR